MQLKKEIIENHEFFVYTLMPGERLDTVTLGMMENNAIHGLLPVRFLQKDEHQILRYDISGTTVLADFLEQDENGLKLLLLLKGMADDLLGAKEYMIEDTSFLLGLDSVFVGEDGTGRLVCLPVENRDVTGFYQFCLELVHQPAVARHMAYGPLSQVKSYLQKEFPMKEFSIREFSMMLDKIELRSAMQPDQKKGAVKKQGEPIILGKKERVPSQPIILSKAVQKTGQNVAADSPRFAGNRTQLVAEKKMPRGYLYRISSQEKKEVDKTEFRIGKSRAGTDYCVGNNPTVSRLHAMIVQKGGSFYITDMNSLNHTYVNHVMVHQGQAVKLANGAAVRLADEEFLFIIE